MPLLWMDDEQGSWLAVREVFDEEGGAQVHPAYDVAAANELVRTNGAAAYNKVVIDIVVPLGGFAVPVDAAASAPISGHGGLIFYHVHPDLHSKMLVLTVLSEDAVRALGIPASIPVVSKANLDLERIRAWMK